MSDYGAVCYSLWRRIRKRRRKQALIRIFAVVIIIVIIIVSAEDFVEDFFSGFVFFLLKIRLLIERFLLTVGCCAGYHTDTQTENRTESGAVFIGFNTLSALVRVFGIIVNDF